MAKRHIWNKMEYHNLIFMVFRLLRKLAITTLDKKFCIL